MGSETTLSRIIRQESRLNHCGGSRPPRSQERPGSENGGNLLSAGLGCQTIIRACQVLVHLPLCAN